MSCIRDWTKSNSDEKKLKSTKKIIITETPSSDCIQKIRLIQSHSWLKKKENLTDRLLHTTTSCWYEWRGRGGHGLSCGMSLFQRPLWCTCWRRYEQPPRILKKSAGTHQTAGARSGGTRQRWPSYDPGQKYGSWSLFIHRTKKI